LESEPIQSQMNFDLAHFANFNKHRTLDREVIFKTALVFFLNYLCAQSPQERLGGSPSRANLSRSENDLLRNGTILRQLRLTCGISAPAWICSQQQRKYEVGSEKQSKSSLQLGSWVEMPGQVRFRTLALTLLIHMRARPEDERKLI